MTITEQFICGKHTAADYEDGIVITPHYIFLDKKYSNKMFWLEYLVNI